MKNIVESIEGSMISEYVYDEDTFINYAQTYIEECENIDDVEIDEDKFNQIVDDALNLDESYDWADRVEFFKKEIENLNEGTYNKVLRGVRVASRVSNRAMKTVGNNKARMTQAQARKAQRSRPKKN